MIDLYTQPTFQPSIQFSYARRKHFDTFANTDHFIIEFDLANNLPPSTTITNINDLCFGCLSESF